MMIALKPRYTVVVQWLDEDDCFVVSFLRNGESFVILMGQPT